jgi:hypothetical protein
VEDDLIDKLAVICEEHACPNGVVFSESYVPYIPDDWNRVLVLAEAQNLSEKNPENAEYRKRLSELKLSRDRILRLQPKQLQELRRKDGIDPPPWDGIGVQPWDDGLLPLAVATALKDVDPKRVAVSNAVPWSRKTGTGANARPTHDLQERATLFWQEILACMRPSHIVAAGAVARKVMKSADVKLTIWGSPSPRVLSVLSDSVNREELRTRFGTDVDDVLRRWNEGGVLERQWAKGKWNRLYAYLAIWKTRGLCPR